MKLNSAPQMQSQAGIAAAEAAAWGKAERIAEAIKKRMTAPAEEGQPSPLNLPPLLESRRHQYGIPDAAFEQVALYDWILVHQIPPKWNENGRDTYDGTSILKIDKVKDRDTIESSRGVIVSAGLKALDSLRSNGIDLGHVVSFVRIAPWIRPTASFDGYEYNMIVLKDGDLITSEDAQAELRSGRTRVQWDDSAKQHVFAAPDGQVWAPAKPYSDDSY